MVVAASTVSGLQVAAGRQALDRNHLARVVVVFISMARSALATQITRRVAAVAAVAGGIPVSFCRGRRRADLDLVLADLLAVRCSDLPGALTGSRIMIQVFRASMFWRHMTLSAL